MSLHGDADQPLAEDEGTAIVAGTNIEVVVEGADEVFAYRLGQLLQAKCSVPDLRHAMVQQFGRVIVFQVQLPPSGIAGIVVFHGLLVGHRDLGHSPEYCRRLDPQQGNVVLQLMVLVVHHHRGYGDDLATAPEICDPQLDGDFGHRYAPDTLGGSKDDSRVDDAAAALVIPIDLHGGNEGPILEVRLEAFVDAVGASREPQKPHRAGVQEHYDLGDGALLGFEDVFAKLGNNRNDLEAFHYFVLVIRCTSLLLGFKGVWPLFSLYFN